MPSIRTAIKILRVLPKLGLMQCFWLVRHKLKRRWWCRWRTTAESVLPEWLVGARAPLAERTAIDDEATDSVALEDYVRRLRDGEHLFFGWHWQRRQWLTDPLSGEVLNQDDWVRTSEAAVVDVKWVWDQSRFDWVPRLIRHAILRPDGEAGQVFWTLLRAWVKDNPPRRGLAWGCAQESSIRLINIVFGLAQFAAPSQDDEQAAWGLVAELASRIQSTVDYGRAQRNNHGLTEATALFMAGLSLPQHRRASAWCEYGKQAFVEQLKDQFAEDGSYILDSFSYHRQALRVATLWLALARSSGEAIDPIVEERVAAAALFLKDHLDPQTGGVPNYGQTDGSNLFDFSGAGPNDYRPAVREAYRVAKGEEPLSSFEISSFEIREHKVGGYFALVTPDAHAFIRCHAIKRRPGHADMLHFDLWAAGINVLCDSGTYSYVAQSKDGAWLRSTAAHNTLQIDGLDQMTPFRRFLWLDWTMARVLYSRHVSEAGGERIEWSGEHDGYRRHPRAIVHRRSLSCAKGVWTVTDEVLPETDTGKSFEVALHWNLGSALQWRATVTGAEAKLPDGRTVTIGIALNAGFADQDCIAMKIEVEPRSPLYGQLIAAQQLTASFRTIGMVAIETTIRFS